MGASNGTSPEGYLSEDDPIDDEVAAEVKAAMGPYGRERFSNGD